MSCLNTRLGGLFCLLPCLALMTKRSCARAAVFVFSPSPCQNRHSRPAISCNIKVYPSGLFVFSANAFFGVVPVVSLSLAPLFAVTPPPLQLAASSAPSSLILDRFIRFDLSCHHVIVGFSSSARHSLELIAAISWPLGDRKTRASTHAQQTPTETALDKSDLCTPNDTKKSEHKKSNR